MSLVSKVLLSCTWLFAAVALVVTLCHKITWLTYLYYFSYIKIGVTLIKYIPQVRSVTCHNLFDRNLIVPRALSMVKIEVHRCSAF